MSSGRPADFLGENELPPPPAINYVADQLGVSAHYFSIYAHRTQTHFEHSRYLTDYLGLHVANKDDRRAALLAAAEAAASGDKGFAIAMAVVGIVTRVVRRCPESMNKEATR
ncbi:DUF4158 domain-containing protein [Sinorhizobium medicae]|uniref:DUF4158 domain-containing protein n=1 Tax=Sinorhizobium medicae TaxID=110321 RepID=UPI003120467C